jgi:4,5-DOPA dioxygenase extradiol
MPALFIGHGTPLNGIWDNEFTRAWARLGSELPRPRVILSVSAHWVTPGGTHVTAGKAPPVIYDMYGFPAELYRIEYPAPGDDAFAESLCARLQSRRVTPSGEWGYDHGTWSVLVHMYPAAEIPVVQLSLDYNMSPEQHLEFARELDYLRDEGVLILGTGQLVHNLRLAGSRTRPVPPYDWAVEFDETCKAWVDARDFRSAARFHTLGELALMAHPTHEHYLPLLYALGVATDEDALTWVTEGIVSGCHSMRSLMVDARAA